MKITLNLYKEQEESCMAEKSKEISPPEKMELIINALKKNEALWRCQCEYMRNNGLVMLISPDE